MKPFVGLSGWHRGPGLGCYESDDRRAAVEKVWREKAWKLWLYEGWLRRSSKHVGTYPTRKAAMMAYQPNPKAHDLRSNIVEPVVGSLNL